MSRDEVGVFPIFGYFGLKLLEVFIRPTNFHLCMSNSDS
jgi:hypothetical protein